jgi:hypothetical protein
MRERLWPDIRGASDVCLRWLAERWGICSHREDYRKCASHRFGIDQGKTTFHLVTLGSNQAGEEASCPLPRVLQRHRALELEIEKDDRKQR